MAKEMVTLTNMCMIYDGDRVLVQKKENTRWDGICFPGGHVEMGESFTDGVIREVKEETGLDIFSPQLCGIKDWTREDGSRYIVLFYKTNQFSGVARSSDEGQVFWTNFKELGQMDLARGMDDMIKIFMQEDLSEMYYSLKEEKWLLK